jgi:hypothetical protein
MTMSDSGIVRDDSDDDSDDNSDDYITDDSDYISDQNDDDNMLVVRVMIGCTGHVNIGSVEFCMDDANAVNLALDLSNNTRLNKLTLCSACHCEFVNTRSYELLFDWIANNEFIEEYYIHRLRPLGMEMIKAMTPMLTNNNNSPNRITLYKCKLGVEEMHLFGTHLKSRGIPLNELILDRNTVLGDDGVIKPLVCAFNGKLCLFPKRFKALFVKNPDFIAKVECASIACILQDPKCAMEELTMKIVLPMYLNEDVPICFANALAENESLCKLDIGEFRLTKHVSKAFIKMVCNKSSINSTYTSNHTLVKIEHMHVHRGQEENHGVMMQYFDMNVNSDKKSVACQKVLMHHFSGQFSMMEFEEMEPDLLMRSLIFLDKWENNNGESYLVPRHLILFHLIKSYPMIVVHN